MLQKHNDKIIQNTGSDDYLSLRLCSLIYTCFKKLRIEFFSFNVAIIKIFPLFTVAK